MAPRTVATLVFIAAACAAAPAAAQPPTVDPVDVAITDRARELYNAGGKAFAKGDYPAAHAAFLAAWGIKRHWQIAASLAQTEVALKKWRDAAEHASFYMRNSPPDRRARAAGLLAQATPHVAARTVTVSEPGADASLDGKHIELGPEPVYVDPGHHVLEARLGAKHARAEFDAVADSGEPIALTLVEDAALPPITNQPPPIPPVTPDPPRKSVPLIVAGFSVAAVGVGLGVAGLAASGSASSEVETISKRLRPEGSSVCSFTPTSADCTGLQAAFKREGSWRNVAITSFVVGGAAALGTVIYIALPERAPAPAAAVGLGPGRLTLSGRF